ncbi:cellulose biosynthesis cyclic di-GMP-binding regulatory protein BcsB [Belliella kenyensis]|uniref:Cellulose biosynthesis cyclic di-GMP-binding regulatory protein BcsB n=1 Tax=Belliella kenyensis TaxID=1472724 RepID=A0ABV8EHP1_9BACT|nr:cellulose biosynthesis cyclic di-GMP-binding regulatory protein BcsB [Belliella kenyensis]MCH7402722.1 cellulose biosynthesis cyclic di-GMP-binding regulatory protein BcsB [Belliella kenyensis]MDN3603730.1 cellulose biosynthesis cyclic di-GMP-binding regulatory protein BcsB [Belliella kenyensis]
MRLSLLILVLFFNCQLFVIAKDTIKRPFTEFGYPKNTISFGKKSGAVFYIADDPLRDFSQSGFYLEIMVSPLIQKEKSQINIKLDDTPVMSLNLGEQADTLKVFVPLQKRANGSGFLKLAIEPSLWYENEDCMDIDQKSIWLRVSDNSYFLDRTLEPATVKKEWNIAEFLPSVQTILIPKANLESYASAVSHLHFFFLHNQGKNLSLKFLEDADPLDFHHALIVGESSLVKKSLPASFATSKELDSNPIAIYSFEYMDSLRNQTIYLNNLIVTSKNSGDLDILTQNLFTDYGKSVLLNESFSIVEKHTSYDRTYKFDTKQKYNLSELGMDEEVISGKGRVRKNFLIPEFLAKPSLNTLSVDLSVNYSPVGKNDKAYLNVFINNRLLQTYQLDDSGVLEKSIAARKAQFGASNYIGFEFIYIPEGGMCDEAAADFFAQINPKNSFIGLQFHNRIPETLHAFPSNFDGKEVGIIYDYDLSLDDIKHFSKIISLLNIRDTKALGIYLPKVTGTKNITDDAGEMNLILVSRSGNNFESLLQDSPYVEFSKSKIIYRSDELEKFFGFIPDKQLNYVQLLDNGSNKVLKFNLFSKDRLAFEKLLDGFREQFLTNTGNVMIANSKRYFFFDLSQTDVKNQKLESEARFESFWHGYRILIISILAALVIVLLIYIYKKSRFAQKSIEDARK